MGVILGHGNGEWLSWIGSCNNFIKLIVFPQMIIKHIISVQAYFSLKNYPFHVVFKMFLKVRCSADWKLYVHAQTCFSMLMQVFCISWFLVSKKSLSVSIFASHCPGRSVGGELLVWRFSGHAGWMLAAETINAILLIAPGYLLLSEKPFLDSLFRF